MTTEEQKAQRRDISRRYRERLKAAGRKPSPKSPISKAKNREALALKRQQAREEGRRLPSDLWAAENPNAHRERVARWRAENPEPASRIARETQSSRRSTPWGAINNRMWPIVHSGVRRNSSGKGKYNVALGYLWCDLRAHLESQFTPPMSWENWGTVWELDHVIPLSSFHFLTIDDPLFVAAWRLTNLRPLLRNENQVKGKSLAG